jgi:hypothetical protein
MNGQVISLDTAVDVELSVKDEQAIDVYCWRMEQLLRVGYSHMLADAIAADSTLDLHLACDLLNRGCPEQTAYLILF